MFNTFTFNGLGFNYLGLFHYSWDLRPTMKQQKPEKPVMVDVRFL